MKQIVRNGVELDICPTSGGVWLDKGELEKLLSAVQEALNETDEDFETFKRAKADRRPDYVNMPPPPPEYRYSRKKYDDDDYEDYHKYKYGKKSRLKSILDIFD